MRVASWAGDVLDLVLPSGCVVCGNWIPGGRSAHLWCGRCSTRLKTASWPRCPRCHFPRATGRAPDADCSECLAWPDALHSARFAYFLEGPAADLVHALKYEGWPELGAPMAAAVAHLDVPRIDGAELVVVPVPTTSRRESSRGYNQALLLADGVARSLGAPLAMALRRTSASASQTSLPPSERAANVRGAFSPTADGTASVAGRHVLLVDDVLTTGATAAEGASVLGSMGALAVTALAFARARPVGLHRAR